jgi:hypothetical protein
MNDQPKDAEDEIPANFHIDDEFIHIHRHKGTRARLELYVHNRDFRQWLGEREVLIPSEKVGPRKVLRKKLLFYSLEYGKFLQSVCKCLSLIQKSGSDDDLRSFLQAIDSLHQELTKGCDPQAVLWDEVYLKLGKRVRTTIYELS